MGAIVVVVFMFLLGSCQKPPDAPYQVRKAEVIPEAEVQADRSEWFDFGKVATKYGNANVRLVRYPDTPGVLQLEYETEPGQAVYRPLRTDIWHKVNGFVAANGDITGIHFVEFKGVFGKTKDGKDHQFVYNGTRLEVTVSD